MSELVIRKDNREECREDEHQHEDGDDKASRRIVFVLPNGVEEVVELDKASAKRRHAAEERLDGRRLFPRLRRNRPFGARRRDRHREQLHAVGEKWRRVRHRFCLMSGQNE